jgi:prefoldin beta subunit
MPSETEEKIGRMQILEQNIQNLLMQKHQFQSQIVEIRSALEELESSETSYKIIGNIMVAAKKEDLKKDLESKKEMVELRIKSIEKQEEELKEKTKKLQGEVLDEMKE